MTLDGSYYWIFLLLILVVAFMYSAVGHGGASGYLALMAFFSFPQNTMKATALILNLFVAGVATFHYYRAGYLNFRLFGYFALSSVPMAFLGGTLEVAPDIYKKSLGVLLLFAVLKILNVTSKEHKNTIVDIKFWQGLLIGAIIGFFSGLIGIGGGIILSPVILLLHWGKMKEAAAVSALFIWVNSMAGFIGMFSQGTRLDNSIIAMVGMALLGGFLGSYYGSFKVTNRRLNYLLSFVLIIASIKLLFV